MKSITSTATFEKLREMFATNGIPATLVSDNGSSFTSSEFQEFTTRNGIKHIKVAPYHPASNGLAERAVRIFKEGYEKMEGGSVQTKLSRFLLSYRTSPHSTTGVLPTELLMKRRLHTQLNQRVPSIVNRVRNKQSQQKAGVLNDQIFKKALFRFRTTNWNLLSVFWLIINFPGKKIAAPQSQQDEVQRIPFASQQIH